jgi:four helix bundle protein
MKHRYGFEKLEVWQESRELVKDIYVATSQFPQQEKFGLTSQLRRAAISISSNIAEGSSRRSQKDQARFYEIAYGSLIEVLNQLILAQDLQYLSPDRLEAIRPKIDRIGRMLNGLRQSIQKHADS